MDKIYSATTTVQDGDNQYEVRTLMFGGLACPNPREYYKNTRSYDDMRREYNLLNCGIITDEQILITVSANKNSLIPFTLFYWSMLAATAILIGVL